MSQKKPILSRRNFLLSVGAGSAATAAAVISKQAPEAAKQVASNDKRSTRGYQETAHVTNYYRTTKV